VLARSGTRGSEPLDRDQTVGVKRQGGGPSGAGGAAPDRKGEVAGAGRVQALGGSRSPDLARTGEKGPANSMVGFQPRDLDQRRENSGGKCHTRVLGVPNPSANFTKCARIKSHTYDDPWYRNERHIINI
jgi:hypothetical protein